jgi:putative oxidoreductase
MNTGLADDLGKLILRLTLSILILFHGIHKLTTFQDTSGHMSGMVQSIGLPSWVSYGVFLGEVLGPILLLIGWYARIGAALIFINMIFAFVLAHRHGLLALDPKGTGGWALELQGMYLLTALALVLTGPGRPAVNNR